MAVYNNFGLSSNLNYWFSRDASSILTASSSSVDLVNTDGTHTVLTSAGNDFTFTNSGGVITLTGGTITTMARTDGASTTYENVTGLSYSATTFQSRLPNSDLQAVASDIFTGADTFNGSPLNEFIKTFGGNDTVNGGAGFDTLSYLSSFMTGPVTITVGTTNTVGAPTVATGTATAASNTIGTDTFNNVEGFIGTAGNDTYTAFTNFLTLTNNNTLNSFNQFEGVGGNDTIVGNGNTRIAFNSSFSSGPTGATVTWTNSASNTNGSGTSTGAGIGTDTFSGVNGVLGSQFNDVFTATGASNAAYGVLDGGFQFNGLGGNDLLTGGGTNLRWDFNIARYDNETSGITTTLGTTNSVGAPTTDVGSVTGASAGTDTLHFIEAIRGTNFVDTYTAFADFRGIFGIYNEFEGMAGNDTITGNGSTRVAFGNATAGVTVTWTPTAGNTFIGNGTSTGDSSVGTDTFTGVNGARGSNLADTFTATGAHGTFNFDGRGGDDVFNGGTFNFETIDFDIAHYHRSTSGITVVMDSTSTVSGDASVGTDTLYQVEQVRGSHFNDTYTATQAFSASFGKLNVFSPGGGDDSITGNGATQLDYRAGGSAFAAVTVNLNTGVAQSTAGGDLAQIGTDTFTGVNGVRGSQFDDTLIGSNGSQSEIFRGEEGNDLIDGGGGSHNTANYSDSIAGIVADLTAGTASDGWGGTDTLVHIQDVFGSEFADTITGDSGSNILVGKSGDDSLFGGGGNDILIGDDNGFNQVTNNAFGTFGEFAVGNDTLDGGTGADQMTGGKGNDIYVVDNVGDVVTENSNEGTDTVQTTLASYTLGSSVENLTFTDAGAHTGSGNELDNVITGGSGNDTIFAGAGQDTLTGGDGNDVLVGNGGGADLFTATPDHFSGGNGSDTLYVKAGDFIDGGTGLDFVHLVNDNAININLGTTSIEWIETLFGNDTIDASTQTVGVEVYSDGGNDTITGSAFNDIVWSGSGSDTVIGGDGDDVIVGDVGADSISGGNGNDSLYVDSSDTFIDGGAGYDAAYITSGSGITLNLATTHLEFVADFVPGGGNDTIDGSGASASLTVYAAGGADTVTGGSGADFLWGGTGNDTIAGNSGNDTLVGEAGADRLIGGAGTDNLYGNAGNGGDGAVDTFVFNDSWGTDFVFDFEPGTDKLDLSAVTGVNSFSDLTLTNTPDGHCYVSFAGNLIAVAHMAGQLTQSDFIL